MPNEIVPTDPTLGLAARRAASRSVDEVFSCPVCRAAFLDDGLAKGEAEFIARTDGPAAAVSFTREFLEEHHLDVCALGDG